MRKVLAALLGGVVLLGASRPELLEVPFPDLSPLEPAVAGQIGEAQELLQQALGEDGVDASELAETYGELGKLYHAYELVEPARACYRNALRLAPEEPRWSYYLAYLEQHAGQLAEAAGLYRQVLALQPANLAATVHLGEVAYAQGHWEEASQALGAALALDPGSAAAHALLGQVALAEHRPDEAVAQLEAALAAAPAADRLHYPLALAYRALGETDKARQHLAQRGMVGVRPPDPLVDELQQVVAGERLQLLRGRIAFRAGRYAEATEAFRAAAQAAPESARARVNLASALGSLGDRQGALMELERALELDPDNVAAHFNAGSLLADAGRYDAARAHFEAVLRADPTDLEARLGLATALRRSGRAEAALAEISRVIESDPLREAAYLSRAEILVDGGRYGDAIRGLEEARRLLPDSGLLAHVLARLLAACPAVALRDGQRALELALRVFAAQSSVSHAETVALALAELDRCEEAAEWQRRAVAAAAGHEELSQRLEGTLRRYETERPCAAPGVGAPLPTG